MVSSRRRWIAESVVGVACSTVLVLGTPQKAAADVTNKVASTSALRNVKRSQKQLDTLELYVVNSQYEELKEAVRVAPLAEVRKNCNVVIRGAEDGPNEEDLLKMYKNFIQQLELMDGTASLGMRGRDLPPEQLSEQYKSTVAALADFVKVAEDAVEVPLQSDEETS